MRTITIKQFQTNIYKELVDLPIQVTRNGKPAFVVTAPGEVATIAPTMPHEVATKPKPHDWDNIAPATVLPFSKYGQAHNKTYKK